MLILRAALPFFLLLVRPSFAQQDPPRWDCCFHILSVGANLAWAEALTRASIPRTRLEPADQTILDNLERAARHAETAMTVCSRFNPVQWHQLPFDIRTQAEGLRQRPVPDRRAAVTTALAGMYQWYKPLNSIRLDTWQGSADNCEGLYFRLAWHISAVVQNLRIVQEGRSRGMQVSRFVDEARGHARTGLSLVNSYNAKPDCARTNLSPYWASLTRVTREEYVEGALQDVDAAWLRFQSDVVERCPQPAGVFDGASMPGFCILRKPVFPVREDGRVCYEFYLADASVPGAARLVTIAASTAGGVPRCFTTAYAHRSGWQAEPSTLGGPFRNRLDADAALSQLSRYQRDAYSCFETNPFPRQRPQPDPRLPPDGGRVPPPPQPPQGVRTVTVSGNLDQSVVAPKVEARRREGVAATFRSNTLTISIGPNGACTITPTLQFESLFMLRGAFRERVVKDFQLFGATATPNGEGCSGRYRVTEALTVQNGQTTRSGPGEGRWSASRQRDGTWVFGIPNGVPGRYGDIPYLLREAGR